MDISQYQDAHTAIAERIAHMRQLNKAGINTNTAALAQTVQQLANIVLRHLAQEDRELYPALERSSDTQIAKMSVAYRKSIGGLSQDFNAFAKRWSQADELERAPAEFRAAANDVVKRLHERLQREDHHFHPAIAKLSETPARKRA